MALTYSGWKRPLCCGHTQQISVCSYSHSDKGRWLYRKLTVSFVLDRHLTATAASRSECAGCCSPAGRAVSLHQDHCSTWWLDVVNTVLQSHSVFLMSLCYLRILANNYAVMWQEEIITALQMKYGAIDHSVLFSYTVCVNIALGSGQLSIPWHVRWLDLSLLICCDVRVPLL